MNFSGRALDAVIAKQVMGWNSLRDDQQAPDRRVMGLPPNETLHSEVPRYSTKVADAEAVVQKMGDLGFIFTLRYGKNKNEGATAVFTDENSTHSEAKGTWAKAICEAALKALRRRNDAETWRMDIEKTLRIACATQDQAVLNQAMQELKELEIL